MTTTNDLNNRPIFIVGAPRSGTTVMRQILNRHSELYLADETHYFEDLRQKIGSKRRLPTSEERKLIEDYFLALTHKWYGEEGDPEQGWMDRQELRMLAQQLGSGTDAYFEAFCRLCAARNNKIRWGEKTPRHVFQLSTIFSLYPNAQVICIVRHPAGVVASYRDWKNSVSPLQKSRLTKTYSLAFVSLSWKAAFNAAVEARNQFGEDRVYLQRYEDLVSEPESALKVLTSWLSLDYQPSMLEVDCVNSSYSKSWRQSGTSLSSEAVHRWREKLSKREISSVQAFCGNLLEKAGYEKEPISCSPALVVWLWTTLPFVGMRALLANQNRMSKLPDYIWRRLRFAIGQRNRSA